MGGSSSQPQTTTQTTKVELPEWVNTAAQSNYAQAQQASQNLAGPYQGQRVADMTSGQLANINALQNNVGSTQPVYNAALGITGNAANYAPTQVQGADIASNLPQFMNPYIQNVINPTLSVLDQNRQIALNQIGDQAARAGAFGGSRQGVQEGVTNAQYGMQGAQLAGRPEEMHAHSGFVEAGHRTDLTRGAVAEVAEHEDGPLAAVQSIDRCRQALTPLTGGVYALLALSHALRRGFEGIVQPLMFSLQARAVSRDLQGAVVGLRVTNNRLSSVITPLIMGLIVEFFGLANGFYAMGALLLAGCCALAIAVARSPALRTGEI